MRGTLTCGYHRTFPEGQQTLETYGSWYSVLFLNICLGFVWKRKSGFVDVPFCWVKDNLYNVYV